MQRSRNCFDFKSCPQRETEKYLLDPHLHPANPHPHPHPPHVSYIHPVKISPPLPLFLAPAMFTGVDWMGKEGCSKNKYTASKRKRKLRVHGQNGRNRPRASNCRLLKGLPEHCINHAQHSHGPHRQKEEKTTGLRFLALNDVLGT